MGPPKTGPQDREANEGPLAPPDGVQAKASKFKMTNKN
jgi:hypothetical protein